MVDPNMLVGYKKGPEEFRQLIKMLQTQIKNLRLKVPVPERKIGLLEIRIVKWKKRLEEFRDEVNKT